MSHKHIQSITVCQYSTNNTSMHINTSHTEDEFLEILSNASQFFSGSIELDENEETFQTRKVNNFKKKLRRQVDGNLVKFLI